MKLIVPFFKKKQMVSRQYTRRLNDQSIFLTIIRTLKDYTNIPFEIWTDISEIYKESQNHNIVSTLLEDLDNSLYDKQDIYFLNPNYPFISDKTLVEVWKEVNSDCNIISIRYKKYIILSRLILPNDNPFITEPDKCKSIIIDENELIDISKRHGWWLAEKILKEKKVLIHPLSSSKMGTGHIYRGLTIASQLVIDHEVVFLFRQDQRLGIEMVKSEGHSVLTYEDKILDTIKEYEPDIVINDLLNTSLEYILELKEKGYRVINFEDMGEGAIHADAVINALYPGDVPQENFYTGEQYYCIREDFIGVPKKELSDKVKEVLITYGGEDPNFLTKTTLLGLAKLQKEVKFNISIILGPAFSRHSELREIMDDLKIGGVLSVYDVVQDMALYMRKADLIFTSAGRTMYEIATIGTPAVVTAQNYRELTHTFGHPYNGFYNLGYFGEVGINDYYLTAKELISNFELRKLMHARMLKNDFSKGIERVKQIILGE